jgi:hypothetical protein
MILGTATRNFVKTLWISHSMHLLIILLHYLTQPLTATKKRNRKYAGVRIGLSIVEANEFRVGSLIRGVAIGGYKEMSSIFADQ